MMELESYFNKTNKKSVSFRLSETVIKRLKDMSERLNVSQAEIIELLVSAMYFSGTDENNAPYKNLKYFEKVLEMCEEQLKQMPNNMDIDILGEVYNVSMGAAAANMGTLLRKKVVIDMPKIEMVKSDLLFIPNALAVGVKVKYAAGFQGEAVFIFNQRDVMKMVNVWLGGSGQVDEKDKFGDMHAGALGELMNQMMGQSSMALAGFLNITIDMSGSAIYEITGNNIMMDGVYADDTVAATMLNFTVEGVIDSKILAVTSLELAKSMVRMAKKSFGMQSES